MTEEAITSAIATVILAHATDESHETAIESHVSSSLSLMTVIETEPPMTYTTTNILGSPQTIITTPPPRTKVSTIGINWGGPKTIILTAGGGMNPHPDYPPFHNETVIIATAAYSLTPFKYFLGSFLPTLLATFLAFPLTLIDIQAKRIQPYHALTRKGDSTVSNSLSLSLDGMINSFIAPHRLLFQGQPLIYLTSLLTWCTWLLVPLAAETIGLRVHGNCSSVEIRGCAVELEISQKPLNALLVLLALMILVLILLLFVLKRWDTGVYSDPWSITGNASLMADVNVKAVVKTIGEEKGKKGKSEGYPSLANQRFTLGVSSNGPYGIIPFGEAYEQLLPSDHSNPPKPIQPQKTNPFKSLTYAWRITSTFIHLLVLVLIAYYLHYLATHTSGPIPNIWKGFGFRFLLAAVAQIISLFWSDLFTPISTITPFHLMSQTPQPPPKSILLTPSTNEFVGLYTSLKYRISFLGITATITLLSRFLPMVMTNIAYTNQQTYPSFLICSGMSIAILGLMSLTLIGSMLLIKFPNLPMEVRTVAGLGWYVVNAKSYHGIFVNGDRDRMMIEDELGLRIGYDDGIGLYVVVKNGMTSKTAVGIRQEDQRSSPRRG
ncbi:hypothetical protein QBC38DRAFT_404250 [Podospora fimiseda]|uniref:Uncharacterized protein n=1 Tax=Podospora fimiseda TaxID=252190 RepID=A0AAN6YKQ2_9PEZI|nr:hypothetical protein QBC38DRAFT_404250 [Podospora fimiseda]